VTITIVIVGVGICVYYFHDNGGHDSNPPNNQLSNFQDNDNILGTIRESQTLNNIIENIYEAVDRNYDDYLNINGVISEDTDLALLFPKWELSETQILETFHVSKIEMVEFLQSIIDEDPEFFQRTYQDAEFSREVVLQIKENLVLFFIT